MLYILPLQPRYFNSLPHTEVDSYRLHTDRSTRLFQLTTSHRGRQRETERGRGLQHFNSLPHTEVDYYTSILPYKNIFHFNSLPHTEVDFRIKALISFGDVFQLTTSHRGRP